MKLFPRVLASSVALTLLAASCGPGTGEGVATPAPTQAVTQPTATTAAPAKPTHLLVIGDTVRGQAGLTDEEKKLDVGTGLHCVVMSRFPQGSRIVWRIKVLDPLTLRSLDDKELQYVRLTLPDGKVEPLNYGGHGGTRENPADRFWAAGFTVPNDYPTGVFNFKIEAKSLEGASGTFAYDAFKVSFAQLQIIPAAGTRRF